MLPKRTCSIPDCNRPYSCRGLCAKHYLNAWSKKALPPKITTEERFRRYCRPVSSGCIEWVGAISSHGYGSFYLSGRMYAAHRFAWELRHGAIPGNLVIDHQCRNIVCVNVDHLRVVTQQVNTLAGQTVAARNAAKTHCKRGHEFTVANTISNAKGHRRCRTCIRACWHAHKHLRNPRRNLLRKNKLRVGHAVSE